MAQLEGLELIEKLEQLYKDGCEFFPTEEEIKSYIWRENNGIRRKDGCARYQEQNCIVYKLTSVFTKREYYYKDCKPDVRVYTTCRKLPTNMLIYSYDEIIAKLTDSKMFAHLEVFKSIGPAKFKSYCGCSVGFTDIYLFFVHPDGKNYVINCI